MKKRLFLMLVILSLWVVSIGGYVFAAGYSAGNQTEIPVIGENVVMEVWSPLEVVTKHMTILMEWEEDQVNPVFLGQVIGEGEMTVTNISPINQAVNFYAEPINIDGDIWPQLEVIVTTNSGIVFRPWTPIVLAPGETIDITAEIKISYGSPISSPFQGVKLRVTVGPPPSLSKE